jgi:hypothetical protein
VQGADPAHQQGVLRRGDCAGRQADEAEGVNRARHPQGRELYSGAEVERRKRQKVL